VPAASEVYLRFVAQGVQESSRHLEGFARAAVNADRQFQDLQRTAGTAWARNMAREAGQATAQLERMRRVMAEGRVSVFFSDLTSKIQGMGRVGAVAFGALSAGIGGYIRSGMQGTAESLQLNRAMTDISYSIASIFTPQIRAAVDWVQKLSYHLMNLTGSQQASARQWVAGALSLTGFLALLPRMTGGMAALTRSRTAADLAMASAWRRPAGGGAPGGGMGLPGVGGLPIVGGLLGGLGSLGALALLAGSSEEGRKALSDLATATAPLVQSFSALIPIVAALARGFATVVQWAMSLPGGGAGRVSPLGAAGLGAAGGGVYGALKLGAAGTTMAGMGLAGGALLAPIAAALAGISNARSERIEVQTDVEALRKDLERVKAEAARAREKPFGGGLVDFDKMQRAIEARIKELGGKGKDVLEPLTPGFEQPADLYRRIAEAASGQRGPAETTAENTTAIAQAMQAVLDAMRAAGVKIPLDRPGEE
jgi:hypothetical protein